MRSWRDLKSSLGLCPVFHRADRIRARVQLCWLALLLIRVLENAGADTRRNVRYALDRLHLVTLATGDGHVAQRSALTSGRRTLRCSTCPSSSRHCRCFELHWLRRLDLCVYTPQSKGAASSVLPFAWVALHLLDVGAT